MPDLIWTGGISETHKVAILASAHQVPIAPHDATVAVSGEAGESPIDAWGHAPVRSEAMEAELEWLRRERGPSSE